MAILTREQKQQFDDDGFLAVEGLVGEEFLAPMRDRMEYLCDHWDSEEAVRVGVGQEMDQGNTAVAKRTATTVRKFSGLVAHEPAFDRYMREASTADVAVELTGKPLGLYADQALMKPPEVGSEKPFHQDNAYFGVTPDDAVVTCWCALDDATVENGCLFYLAGSHKRGLVEHETIEATPHLVPQGLRREDAVPVPARRGTVIFHHGWVLHMSPPNTTKSWRRGMVLHLVRLDAEWSGKSENQEAIR